MSVKLTVSGPVLPISSQAFVPSGKRSIMKPSSLSALSNQLKAIESNVSPVAAREPGLKGRVFHYNFKYLVMGCAHNESKKN